jgi:DNA invertase Pin-like site-specific DNA recombinase
MPAPLCIGYGRSSNDKQEASCPQQHDWARGKARATGAELVAWHEDVGVPGDVLDRPGLNAVFDDLQRHLTAKRPVPVLLTFDQDRLSRATSWATGALMQTLTRLGVERVVTATEELDLYDDGERAIHGIKQDLNKRGYVKQLSKNVSRGFANIAAAGYWPSGQHPYGYRAAGQTRQRKLVFGPPEEVEAVRELFRLAAEGVLSLWGLARVANRKGWPVPAPSALRQKGEPRWTACTVAGILANPAYLGRIVYGRQRSGKYHLAAEGGPVERRGPSQAAPPPIVREKCHDPITDLATFDRVRAALESRVPGVVVSEDPRDVKERERRRGQRRAAREEGRSPRTRRPEQFLFRGRVVCGCCGATMQGRNQYTFHGYQCATWRAQRGCSCNGVREADLVERVAGLLAGELATKATLDRMRKQLEAGRTGRGEALRLAVERGKKHVQSLERQVEKGGKRLLAVSAGVVPVVEKELLRLTGELDAARVELCEVEKQAAAAGAERVSVEELLANLSALPKLLKGADPETRARVVQLAVRGITLRFDVRVSPGGRKLSRWTGATITLRGDGPSYTFTVPQGAS